MVRKIIAIFLSVSLLFSQACQAAGAAQLNLSSYFNPAEGMVEAGKFRPPHLRYFSYEPDADNYKLLLDKGDLKDMQGKELENQIRPLFDYFLIGLSLPNEKFWVNLRPDAPGQIIDDELARTEMGRVMLEADLQLKKDTAGFTSPENSQGKEYWDRLYRKAGEIFGNENVSVPAITRPWIVPGEIIIMASGSSVYIYKASLKVMLEQDYLKDSPAYNFSDPRQKELNEYSSRLIRELIIPRLTREVNTSKKYAQLRQVFFSLILSRWFKEAFKGRSGKYASLIDTSNLDNLTSKENWSRIKYFDQYKKSFEDGEYNFKETVPTPSGAVIRSYVSGGERLDFSLAQGPGSPAKVISGRFDNNAIRAIMNHPGMSIFSSSPFSGGSSSALVIEAFGVFYRAQELFNSRIQGLGEVMTPSASPLEFADLAQKAFESGFLSSRRALENILSWQGPEYSAVHKQLNDEFKRAGTDEEKWREINDAWYRHVAVGTAGLRGKMRPGTNGINKYTLGRFMAAHAQAVISREYLDILQKKGVFDPQAEKTAVVIGGDSRHGSWDPHTKGPGEFIKLEALINLALGVKRVYVFKGPTTTPQLAWSLANLDVDSGYRLISGSMSTASHNPREYNGNKVYHYDGSQATGEFAGLINSRLGSQTTAGLVNLEYRGLKILDNIDAAFKLAVENHDIRFLGRAFEGDREDGYRADELFIERELRQGLYLSKDGGFQSEKIGYEGMKVVVSCLGGGARRNLKDMLEKRGFRPSQIIWVESEPDPDFKEIQGGKPNPELPQTRANALRKAVEVDADMVVWLDPDADRPAAAVKKKISGVARSEDDYLSLNGNQQLAVLAEYLIRELENIAKEGNYKGASYLAKRAGELIGNWSRVTMATTHVSGDLMKVIARSRGINVIETLTGFKYIGKQIEKRNENARRSAGVSYSQWRRLLPEEKIDLFLKSGQEVFILGGEDSLGLITDVDLHDKDALSGVSWLMEIYGRLRNSGVSFDEYQDSLYQTYGYFVEAFPMLTKGNVYGGVVFPEEKAMQIIQGKGQSLLGFFRDRLPLRIVGKKVIAVLDFERQKAYKQDMTSLFDGDYSGLVTHEAQDLLTYQGFNELKGIPLPMTMLKSENAAALRGISSFRHRPIGDETGLGEPLPTEDFVMVLFEDGSKVIIRPSNTEPMGKFYINARGLYESRKETDKWVKDAYSELDSLSDSIARELFPESFKEKSSSSLGDTGGIDFSGDMNILNRNIPGTPIREGMNPARPTALNINMDKELSGMQSMLKGRIMPSLEKLGDDIIYCRKKGSFGIYKEGIILSLVDIGRLSEDYSLDVGQPYAEAIFLAHSANSLFYPVVYEDDMNED